MAGTVTLVEFSKEAKDPLVKGVAMTLWEESQPMKWLPLSTRKKGRELEQKAATASTRDVSAVRIVSGVTCSVHSKIILLVSSMS